MKKQSKNTTSKFPSAPKSHIKTSDKHLDGAVILITLNKDISVDKYSHALLSRFMEYINGVIGAKTTSNYNIIPVKQFTIIIPIYVYTNEEANMKPYDLVSKRAVDIQDLLINYNWKSNANKSHLWIVRSLKILGIDIQTTFVMKSYTPNMDMKPINDDLIIKFPDLKYPYIKRHTTEDNSMITQYVDPYLEDMGLFLNLSIPYDETGMSINALHLYEHMLTKCWDNCEAVDRIELNGSTFPLGICYVYTIHKSLDSLLSHLKETLHWLYDSRKPGFWKSVKAEIDFETIRTISETRKERSLTSFGRSDLHAYDLNYDTKIFEYWSNKPYNVLLCLQKELDLSLINYPKISLNNISRPPNIKLSHIPLEVLKVKSIMKSYTRPMSTDKIKSKLLCKDFKTKSFYGIDCKMTSENEDISMYNSVLHPLLYINKYFTDEELSKYVSHHVNPYTCKMFAQAPVQLKNAALYLENPEDPDFDES